MKGCVRGYSFRCKVWNSINIFSNGVRGSNMVLGMDWLSILGTIEANFGELCLKWK